MAAKRSIKDIAPSEDFREEYHKADEVKDTPLTIENVEWKEGDMGVYAVIECNLNDGNDNILVSCGGKTVVAQLLAVEQASAFPVDAKFVKMGRMWVLE